MSMNNGLRISLIGLGLMGSSIGLALRRAGFTHITGWDSNAEHGETAHGRKAINSLASSLEDAVRGADVVFLNVPVGAMGGLVREFCGYLHPDTIVTDVGSVKGEVMREISPLLPSPQHFVPAHPIAGTEETGPEAGSVHLFKGRFCLLTPAPDANLYSVQTVSMLWQQMGAEPELMDAAHHDIVLAATSHLPHLVAYSLVHTANEMESDIQREIIQYSASGFRDFTRIASSSPEMWRDIFLSNKKSVLNVLKLFSKELAGLQKAIKKNDGAHLEKHFSEASKLRQRIIDAGQDVALPDFGRGKSEED